jgi:hypothetical protein
MSERNYYVTFFVGCHTVRLPRSWHSARAAERKSGGSNAVSGERFSSTRPDLLRGPPILLFNGYRGLPLGVKRPERVTDHSPPYCTEFKNKWRYPSTPPVFLRNVYRDSFHLPCMISRRYLCVGNGRGN